MVTETNIYFDPLRLLKSVIETNVLDINAIRRARSDESKREWIFPTTPDADDENYPRLALVQGQMTQEEFGAGRIICRVRDANGDIRSEMFGTIATVPITVGVFVKKKQNIFNKSTSLVKKWLN